MTDQNAIVIASTVDRLIGQFRAHLLGRSLPAPALVQLHVPQGNVSLQPYYGLNSAEALASLLLWAHSLDEVTAEWWRTTADRLHVSVDGRSSSGLRIHVYTGCEFRETEGLVRLDPDEREVVTLDELYTLAGLLREAQANKGVA